MIAPSSITFRPLYSGHIKPLVYAPQQDPEPLPDEECGRNPLYNNSPYVPPIPFLIYHYLHSLLNHWNSGEIPPQQTKGTISSRFRYLSKLNPQATKFYCEIPPCNHQKTFSRKADLERHLVTQHTPRDLPEKKLSQCPWPDCERKGANGFLRRDKMLQHQDKVHGWRLYDNWGKGIDTVENTG
jgi:hypothetical protein